MQTIRPGYIDSVADIFQSYCRMKNCLEQRKPGYDYCKEHVKKQFQRVKSARERALFIGDKLPLGICWVYFIQQGKKGPVKIGRALDVRARLSALQSSNPTQLYPLVAFLAHESVEFVLHDHFNQDSIRGEWFKPSKIIREFVEQAKKGTFPDYLEHVYKDLDDLRERYNPDL